MRGGVVLVDVGSGNLSHSSRGVKRQNGNKSLPYNTYLPTDLARNYHGFQCSLAQIKNRYQLSGLFCEKTVETLYGWISCLALTAPTVGQVSS